MNNKLQSLIELIQSQNNKEVTNTNEKEDVNRKNDTRIDQEVISNDIFKTLMLQQSIGSKYVECPFRTKYSSLDNWPKAAEIWDRKNKNIPTWQKIQSMSKAITLDQSEGKDATDAAFSSVMYSNEKFQDKKLE